MHRSIFITLFVITAAASAAVVDALAGDRMVAGLARRASVLSASSVKPATPPQQLYLVRSTLATLTDANRTGNYSVLRDTAAPGFQAKHSAADLAAIFAEARKRPIDLAPAIMLEPDTFEATRPTDQLLQLAGTFVSGGDRIAFKLVYAATEGHWRLADVAIGAEAVTAGR